MRTYGTILALLALAIAAFFSEDAELEDLALWALCAANVVAGALLAIQHRSAPRVFLVSAIAGLLAAAYSAIVWALSYLFDRNSALGADMIAVLIASLASLAYLAFGLLLLRRRQER